MIDSYFGGNEWPEALVRLEKLEDGWAGEGSTAFSPRQLLLAHILCSITAVFGLPVEGHVSAPANVDAVVCSPDLSEGHIIGLQCASDDHPFVPGNWPKLLGDWTALCVRLSTATDDSATDDEGETATVEPVRYVVQRRWPEYLRGIRSTDWEDCTTRSWYSRFGVAHDCMTLGSFADKDAPPGTQYRVVRRIDTAVAVQAMVE
jgi:hypothetical protein